MQVLLDGKDIRELPLGWLRQQMGLVAQEPVLFGNTIADNICQGREGASQADVEAAAEAASAHGFILTLPLGYDTRVRCPCSWLPILGSSSSQMWLLPKIPLNASGGDVLRGPDGGDATQPLQKTAVNPLQGLLSERPAVGGGLSHATGYNESPPDCGVYGVVLLPSGLLTVSRGLPAACLRTIQRWRDPKQGCWLSSRLSWLLALHAIRCWCGPQSSCCLSAELSWLPTLRPSNSGALCNQAFASEENQSG